MMIKPRGKFGKMISKEIFENIFSGKTVFVTGHTGFIGSWISLWLKSLGANVVGYSIDIPTKPSMFEIIELKNSITSIVGDVNNLQKLENSLNEFQPSFVFHLAAQPIVRVSYEKPIKTLEDVKIHHQLINEGRKIANLSPIPLERIINHWEMLSNVGEKGFIAWLDEKPLASTFVTTFNGYLNEQGFSRSKYDMENLMNATDLIKWHVIEWSKKSNFKTFDLSGVELDTEDQKHKGIFKFKKKWGGELQKWHQYKYS